MTLCPNNMLKKLKFHRNKKTPLGNINSHMRTKTYDYCYTYDCTKIYDLVTTGERQTESDT